MTASSAGSLGAVTLDQLLAINDEIVALARAGVPLDQGLLQLGHDLPGRLGRISTTLGERLARGETPQQVLDDPSLPPAYRALVTAGMRSGRLALALEGMSTLLRRAVESRRLVAGALAYPLLVLAVAYVLFLFTVSVCVPAVAQFYEGFFPAQRWLTPLVWLTDHVWQWAPWPPLVLAVFLASWYVHEWRAVAVDSGRGVGWLGEHHPSVRNLLRAGRMAVFADVLCVLVEHRVPLPEAIAVAADASGDGRLRCAAGRQAAERLQRGELPATGEFLPGAPPVFRWLLEHQAGQQRWQAGLQRAADSYRRRAQWMAQWLSVYFPLWLTVTIGGTAVALYGLLVFGPFGRLLYLLSQP